MRTTLLHQVLKRGAERLPAAYTEVLVDRDNLNYLAPLAQLVVGVTSPVTSVVDAFRKGSGVPYADYGVDMLEGQAGINRAMFLQELGQDWLPNIPDVHARLQADPPARIAGVNQLQDTDDRAFARLQGHA